MFKQSVQVLIAKTAFVGLQLLLMAVLTNKLEGDSFGMLVYLMGLASLTASISLLGAEKTFIAIDREDSISLSGTLAFLFFCSTLAGGLAVFLFLYYTKPQVSVWLQGKEALFLLIVLSMGCAKIQAVFLRTEKNPLGAEVTANLLRPAGTIIALFVFLWAVDTFETEQALYCYVAGAVGAVFYAATMKGKSGVLLPYFKLEYIKRYFSFSLPYLLISMSQAIGANADLVIVGTLFDFGDVALYGVALKLAGSVVFFNVAVNYVIMPKLAKLLRGEKYIEAQRSVDLATILGFAFSSFTTVLIFIWGEKILLLFGEHYGEAFAVFVIMALGQTVSAWFGPVMQVSMYSKKRGSVSVVFLFSVLVKVIFLVFMGSAWGLVGVAYAYALHLLVLNVFLAIYINRAVGMKHGVAGALKRVMYVY